MEEESKNNLKELRKDTICAIIPAVLNILLNFGFCGVYFLFSSHTPTLYFSFVIMYLIYAIVLAFVKKTHRATYIISAVILIFSVINDIKMVFTSTPIYPSDIYFLGNIGEIAGIVKGDILSHISYLQHGILLVLLIGTCILARMNSITVESKKIRVITAVSVILIFTIMLVPINAKDQFILKTIYDNVMKIPLTEGYVLKGIQDGKSFDISYNYSEEKLQKFKDEMQPKHQDIDMYIVEESKKIEALKPIKKGQMKILNIGGEKLQENLKDIVLYHGSSNTNLTYLDISKGTGNGDQLGRGIYLTADYEQAQSYAGNNGKVYKVKLDDSLKLFNLNDKLSDSIKQQLIKELENSNNKDIKNYICMFNRKVYDVKDKQEGLKFYQDKQKEWEQLDGKYFGNRPKVVKNGNNLQVIYTDYSDIQSAINNMTGENLIDALRGDIDPDVFVTIITNSGYDGVITNNNHWYVIYRDINKVHILNENRKFGNKNKLEEVSRNELLVKTKGETVDRYNKAAGYRGFSIYNIDTSNILRYNSLVVICRVGKYNTAVELEEILYWIQIVAENTKSYTKNQINTKVVTQAIMNSIDGLNIRVDCECGDWKYRMAYQATQWGYKYGTPENRPANIRNPEGRGALCFDGNTLILTDNGYIPIKDIKVGDMVFTHKGQLKKVIETSNHDANNVVDVTIGNKHIICTDNHPFYTSNSHYRDIKFVSLNNIKHTWKVLSPILVLNDNIDINCDFAFILGYYLANGTIGYRTDYLPKKILCSNIRLCVSSDYKDIIAKCLNKIGIEYNYIENDKDKSSYYRLKVSNDAGKELYNFIIKYGNFNYKDEQSKKLNKELPAFKEPNT